MANVNADHCYICGAIIPEGRQLCLNCEQAVTKPKRNLLAISIKHSIYRWKFGMPCVLWGHRTTDAEQRSFAGYTQFPQKAELYTIEEFREHYKDGSIFKFDEPVKMEYGFCKKWRKYDTVFVRYDDYIAYCKAAGLSLDGGGYGEE